MAVKVVRIPAGDWQEYRRLRLAALSEAPTAFLEQYADSIRKPDDFWQDRIARSASSETVATFVAVSGTAMVGMATGFVEADIPDAVSVQLVGMYVAPPYRGQRVSEDLVAAVVGWAVGTVRAERIRLYVTDSNQRALAFYRRVGFALTGLSAPYPPDPKLNELEMAYEILASNGPPGGTKPPRSG